MFGMVTMFHQLAAAGQQGQRWLGTSAPPAASIAAAVTRVRGTSGTVLVSTGFPLTADHGLRPGALQYVKVLVDDVEQAIYVEALEGRHANGAVRSLLLQFDYAVSAGSPVSAEVRLGELRTTTDISKTEIVDLDGFPFDPTEFLNDNPADGYLGVSNTIINAPHDYGYADAVLLATDAEYLLACAMTDADITSVAAAALGEPFETLEDQLAFYSDMYWDAWDYVKPANLGSGYIDYRLLHQQYDRALHEYWMFLRTADPTYYVRASAISWSWQATYGRLGGQLGQINEHFQCPESLALHYWLTGDPLSLELAIAAATRRRNLWFEGRDIGAPRPGERGVDESAPGLDPRITSQQLNLYRVAYELGDTSQDWLAHCEEIVDRIYGVNLSPGADPARRDNTVTPASYTGAWIIGDVVPGGCSISTNFMLAFMSRQLISYYERIAADARIVEIIEGFAMFLETQWRDTNDVSNYYVDGALYNQLGVYGDGLWYETDGPPDPDLIINEADISHSFNYLSGTTCGADGGPKRSVDLNGMFPLMYAWLAHMKGITTDGALWKARCDELLGTLILAKDGLHGPTLNNTLNENFGKQFNEWRFGVLGVHPFLQG